MSLTEMSLRWARGRPSVTTTLLGHTSMAQLDEDLRYFRETKPLPEQLVWDIDRVHMRKYLRRDSNCGILHDTHSRLTGVRIPVWTAACQSSRRHAWGGIGRARAKSANPSREC